ncbi:MAG: prepilin peptidase [Zetaproteobacteria bacterium]|nr:prepilin peptidase [Pseudobdellovibrionaceae bacterium]|tara:strand:+ start:1570 stop:2358 length:789 start_codon:yes stop_codon:yes gene_type:complete
MVILGAIVGSFLNVCILRIPEGTFFKDRRSHCPYCHTCIPFWHNIPILSWLLLRGKASCCQNPIAVQYVLVELFTAFTFGFLYWQFPFFQGSIIHLTIDPAEFIRCLHAIIFTSLLIICSVIDLRLKIIPDVISLPMILFSPVWIWIHPQLNWFSSLLGILFGGGILYLLAWIYLLLRKQSGMGMGDVKLLAAIGGWLGFESILPTLFIGSIVGALIGIAGIVLKKGVDFKTELPFGPFLALGAVLYLVYGPDLIFNLFPSE